MASAAEQLAEELRRIPGVADADVAPDSPEGVKVTLSYGADATGVAAAVRDVLSHHGLRSKMVPPRTNLVPDEPPPPPGSASNVLPGPGLVTTTILPPAPQPQMEEPGVDEPSVDEDAGHDRGPDVQEPVAAPPRGIANHPQPRPVSIPEPARGEAKRPAELRPDAAAPMEPLPAEDNESVEVGRPAPQPGGVTVEPVADTRAGLASVQVEEHRGGITVTVTTEEGRSVTKPGRASEEGVNEAVVAAVGEASGVQPAPVLVEVGDARLGGRAVVTVILQRPDGSVLVGSSVVGAEKAFAVARATWAAINEER